MRKFVMLRNTVYGKGIPKHKFLEISHLHAKHRFNHAHSITKKAKNYEHEHTQSHNKSRLKPLKFIL